MVPPAWLMIPAAAANTGSDKKPVAWLSFERSDSTSCCSCFITCARLAQESGAIARGTLQRCVVEVRDLLPAVRIHAGPSLTLLTQHAGSRAKARVGKAETGRPLTQAPIIVPPACRLHSTHA